ncbi:pentatricopeptide repeat-containing protein At3g03580 [Henckelia pumila]|uniref:pentatricopeptide repeat-containing protein At3g03580 n=1 Tax=Henckelia pumila TaxID=405737 RepID=UPI003C6DF2D8
MKLKHQKLCSNLHLRSEGLYSSLSKSLLSAAKLKDLHKVHSQIITFGLQKSLLFSGQLISKYSQFKYPNYALSVFRVNSSTNYAYVWNAVIRAMTHNGLFAKALEMYGKMRTSNVEPDKYTFPSVINACGGLADFEKGRFVHEHVLELGFEFDLYINNALIDMYSRCNALHRSRGVFDKMPHKDIVSWNSLISGYTSNGFFSEALEIYFQLRMNSSVLDYSTFSSVILACGGLGQITEGEIVHGLVEKIGVRSYVVVNNMLLSMYIKFDMLVNYQKIFNEMVDRDKVTWNTMICGCCESALYEESIRLFTNMVGHLEPDILTITSVLRACTYLRDLKSGRYVHDYMVSNGYECNTSSANIIINMYAKCGDLVGSSKLFESMKSPDIVSWNSLIKGYVENQFYEEAIKLFSRMRMICEIDSVTYVTLLSICTKLIKMNLAEELHCGIIKQGFYSVQIVGNALVDTYAKCGELEDSLKQFENMKIRDKVSWNSIIAACGYSENGILGFSMLKRMRLEGMFPDVPTLLSALPLCSFLIARRQGKEMHGYIFRLGFESIIPIGNALIEMYSNTGNLRNSVLVFKQMKARDVVSWTTMIASYGMHGEGRKSLEIFENMKAAGIHMDHIVFIAIIYACSHSGLVQEGRTCFEQMKKDYKIEPGLQHYACVVDLLSRSGLLIEAEKFIVSMPLQPDASIWGALLSACRASGDMKMAEHVSNHIIELNVDNPGYYVLASNAYAALGKWNQVEMIRTSLKARGLKKDPGCSWVEVQNRVYYFGAGDRFFEKHEEVMELLNYLSSLMAKEGYAADVKSVQYDVEEDEKLDMLCGHSERLAIAYALLHTKPGTSLLVMKNLRVCGDCHTVTKYISRFMHREILVRDANRFHLFKDGACNCGDHW